MRIQVNSDKNIAVDAQVNRFVREEVDRTLGRFKNKVTRIEVHLSDVNSHKFGALDKKCVTEARPAGHQPLVTQMGARTVDSALRGSLTKMRNALETFFGRKVRASTTTRRRIEEPAPASTPAKAKPKTRTSAKPATNAATASSRSPKKKGIHQARRKSWPAR
jgi:hypothetical protein